MFIIIDHDNSGFILLDGSSSSAETLLAAMVSTVSFSSNCSLNISMSPSTCAMSIIFLLDNLYIQRAIVLLEWKV